MASLIEQRGTTRPLRLALLARDHLARLGLERILDDAHQALPVDILVASGNRDAVLVSVQQGTIDLLVASPDAVEDAQAISSAYGTPVLIYARACEAGEVLNRPFSLVVGPTTNEEVASAMTQTVQGVAYRDLSVVALLKRGQRRTAQARRE